MLSPSSSRIPIILTVILVAAVAVMIANANWVGRFGLPISTISDHTAPKQERISASTTFVISQAYGGGGSSQGHWARDFVEIKNISSSPQSLTGLRLIYGSSGGNFGSTAAAVYALTGGTVQPGQYYLVELGSAWPGGAPLPVTPDESTPNVTMTGGNGKVALVTSAFLPNTCGSISTPCVLPNSDIIDLVAWGGTPNAEGGAPTNGGNVLLNPDMGNVRKLNGCQDTDNNNADFDIVISPIPRNTTTEPWSCQGPSPSPTNTATSTSTATNTATPTATGTPISTLGNYADKTTRLSGNETVAPDAAPTNTTRLTVFTDTNFKGKLEGNPVTGVVRITDAHPAGTYLITVRAFDTNGNDALKTFTLTVMAVLACNPVSFAPAALYGAAGEPNGVAVGDFDRDGKQDLVTANRGSANVSVLLGNGNGTFKPAVNFPAGANAISVAVGDLNGDGNQDLAVADLGSFVQILLGNGAGDFGPPTGFPAGSITRFVAVADFDRDGKQDLAVANAGSNDVSILLGDGIGGFGPPANFGVGLDSRSLAVGDFNRDGNPDIASVSRAGMPPISILLGGGTGGFNVTPLTEFPRNFESVAIGELNGDGIQDLIVGDSNGFVQVLLGDGSGGFSSPVFYNVNSPRSVAVGDFNGDAKQDVATAKGAGGASILLGTGDGTLASEVAFTAGSSVKSIAVGDFDGNGDQDIAIADAFSDTNGAWVFNRDCSGVPAIRGTVFYGNATNRFVSNVSITAEGSPVITSATDFLGTYNLTGFGAGSYTVTPSKTGGINGAISSFDAARIAQHATGSVPLSGNNALIAADVSGNDVVNSFDAALIAKYAANLPPYGNAGLWRFYAGLSVPFPVGSTPTSRTYASVSETLTAEHYTGILIGEVSGNWTPSGARPVGSRQLAVGGGPERGIEVELPSVLSSVGKELVIPVSVHGIANKGVISYEFDFKYDPSVIQPLVEPVDVTGTASRRLSVVTNSTVPGLLRVVVYGTMPIDQDGVLLNLKFTTVGSAGSVSSLTFERIMFNEGEPGVSVTDGQIELSDRLIGDN